jgi:cellulose 1,4-beta-cellobiosidase
MLYVMAVAMGAMQALAQSAGSLTEEVHPQLAVQSCTKSSGCTTETKSVVIDSNWRWLHSTVDPKDPVDCYHGNLWNKTLCPDPETCAKNCVLEGANKEYNETYGIMTKGSELSLRLVTKGPYSMNVGGRVYLMDDDDTYKLFQMKNKEFTFDVDVSQLPCGLNGALYFVSMDKDGGKSRHSGNTAGAKYGTGYCDAQCPHDLKWISGEANLLNWTASKEDPNGGRGKYGTCCTEFDIWEANTMGMAYTAHACNNSEPLRCEGEQCGDNGPDRMKGVCDKSGCDFQTYRLGMKNFWGEGSDFVLDTTKPMTVVTQFITKDGTDSGALTEVKRFYKQGGKTIQTPSLKLGDKGPFDSLTQEYCQAEQDDWGGTNFLEKGGFEVTDSALENGMVLALSLWDDTYAGMLWLDATYPVGSTKLGDARGPCNATSGIPKDVEKVYPDATVVYSNIKFGELGSTTADMPDTDVILM